MSSLLSCGQHNQSSSFTAAVTSNDDAMIDDTIESCCNKCEKYKGIYSFYVNNGSRTGRQYTRIDCEKIIQKKRLNTKNRKRCVTKRIHQRMTKSAVKKERKGMESV